MTTIATRPVPSKFAPASTDAPRRRARSFAWALFVLGAGLALNTILGPLMLDAIDYPFSESLRNQTIGLEVVSLFLVAPLCFAAGILTLRERRAGAVLAFGPAAYTAYMF